MQQQVEASPIEVLPIADSSLDGAESYRVGIDLLPEPLVIFSRDGTILKVNTPALRLYEASDSGQLVGKSIYSFGVLAERITKEAANHLHSGKRVRFELEIKTLKGNRRTLEIVDIPLLSGTGEIEAVLGLGRDITERQRAEQARDHLAAIVESSDDAIIEVSPDLHVVTWNEGAEKLLGYNADEAIGRAVLELYIPQEDRNSVRQRILADMTEMRQRSGVVRRIATRLQRKDGAVIEVSLVASGIYDASGIPVGMSTIVRDITVFKQAERAEAMLAGIVNASEDAIVGYSKDLKITSWNPAAEKVYGYTPEEAIGRGFDLFVPPSELAFTHEVARRVLETGQPSNFEALAQRKDGTSLTWMVNIFPIRDSAGNVVAGAGIGRDITRLKQIEKDLREAQEYTRGLIESSIDAMVVVDSDLRITDVNEQLAKLTELPKTVLVGSRFDSYFTDPQCAAVAIQQALADGFVTDYDLVLRSASGREILVSFNASIFYRAGKVFGIFGVARDVTEQRATERKLRKEREYSRTLVESSPDAFLVSDSAQTLTDLNQRASQLTGYSRDELLGTPLSSLFTDPERLAEVLEEASATGLVRDVELALLSRNADQIPVSLNASVYRDGDGAPAGLLVGIRDITEHKRYEEERSLLASIVDYSGDAIISGKPDLTITSWNAAAERLFGYSAAEVIGRNAVLLVPLELRTEMAEQTRTIIARGKPQSFEAQRVRKDGNRVDVTITQSPIFDSSGRLVALSITARDISERKRIEAELTKARDAALEAARLKSEFLANMSHEIRTPLNSIIGMTGLLLDSDLQGEQREFVNDVRNAGDTLLTLINEILDFSKIAAGKLVFEDLNFELTNTVQEAIETIIEQARRKGLEVTVAIEPEAPRFLRGDPGRLRQVLLNLLANSIKFTEHGEIDIKVSKLKENPRETVLRFEVHDTGIGIPKEKQHLLFEPFTQVDASTSRHFGGTGLGLSIARELVARMNGTIAVSSVPGTGSTFWFTATFAKQIDITKPASEMFSSLNGAKVLIVDDNANSREILRRHTLAWGMETATADNATKALEILRGAISAPYAIAIIDVMMPEVDGIELARIIKSDPAVEKTAIIFVSSVGSRENFIRRMRGINCGAWLMKPVPQSSLYNSLVKLLTSENPNDHKAMDEETPVAHATVFKLSSNHRPKVLIAEDNPMNQKLARLQLKKLGIESEAVANGREAVDAVMRFPYDLVLMDCQMPEMDGYEATREIRRRQDAAHHTLIAAMTAHALPGDRDKCLDAGMDAYISKPVELAALEKMLAEVFNNHPPRDPNSGTRAALTFSHDDGTGDALLEAHGRLDAVDGADASPNIAPASAGTDSTSVASDASPAIDPGALSNLQNEDDDLLVELIDLFMNETSTAETKISEALSRGDLTTVARSAHRLRGSAATFGATAMCAICQELETAGNAGNSENVNALFEQLRQECARVIAALKLERSRATTIPTAA